MAGFSKKLLDMLTEFMVCEVGSKAIDGITYTLLLKNNKDKEEIDRYMDIRHEATKCGYGSNELFRVYEIANGYIFDMDIATAKQITAEIVKTLNKNNAKIQNTDLINNMPDQRRKKDMIALGRLLKEEYDKGKSQVELALFSKNSTNRIIINGKNSSGDAVEIRYNAYAIRHWDIELINEKLLIPAGFRVSRIQPCEILPSKTGVSFIFTMEEI